MDAVSLENLKYGDEWWGQYLNNENVVNVIEPAL